MVYTPYTKQTWADAPATDSPISAARLGYMEDGIEGSDLRAYDLILEYLFTPHAAAEQAELNNKQPRFMTGTVATAVGTAAKTVTLDSPWESVTPAAGDMFLLTFTNGNSSSNPSVAINGTTARAIRLGNSNGVTASSASIVSTGVVLLHFNGTYLQQFGSQLNLDHSSSAGGNSIAVRDGNANLLADCFINSTATVATNTGTTTLTINSAQTTILTGTATHTIALPTSSVPAAYSCRIINTSTGAVTVNTAGGTPVAILSGGQSLVLEATQATPTARAHWAMIGGTFIADNAVPPNSLWASGNAENQLRGGGFMSAFVQNDNQVGLSYFTAPRANTITKLGQNVEVVGAGITMARLGLYTVAANGDLTLVARTANNAVALTETAAVNAIALDTVGGYPASYTFIPGQRYAFATYQVGTTRATLTAVQQGAGPLTLAPRLNGAVWSPAGSDLPASISAGGVSVFWHSVWLIGLAA